ncbi:hypothetical protein DB346_05685 [Verrucomicrobia bacterium LW23]|nr:hypothetical protein DB346_05685 [Verrucomicrobia bacterium LW23]
MTVLVTGGTGFVGREIIKKLHEKGYKLRLLVRNADSAWQLQRRYNAELVEGDINKPETLAPAVKGVNAIIHLVGILFESSSSSTFQKVHAEGTMHLANAAKAAGVRRFVLMSAAGTRPNANSTYHQSKYAAECTIGTPDFDFTIFRPSVIYGPNDQSINRLAGNLRFPWDMINVYAYPNPSGGEVMVQPIHVEEVATCFVESLGNAEANGKIYTLCGPKPVRARDIIGAVATAMGKKYEFEDLPILTVVRSVLWAFVAAIPLAIVLFSTNSMLNEFWPVLLLMCLVWAVLLFIAVRWRSYIFYNVPVNINILHAARDAINPILPYSLQLGEQAKLLQEDNIGDPEPASKAFGIQPKPFGPEVLGYLAR